MALGKAYGLDEVRIQRTLPKNVSGLSRPYGLGWTTDQAQFYTLEKDSHRFTLGNGFGSAGEGIGSEAYAYPDERPDRGEGLTVFSDETNTGFPYGDASSTIRRTAWAVSDRVEVHEDAGRSGGLQRRFVQVLNSDWPGGPNTSRLIVAHGFMPLMGNMSSDPAIIELGDGGEAHDVAVAFFNPELVTTPAVALWNDSGTLWAVSLVFPQTDVESLDLLYDYPPDVTMGTPTVIATGLAASAAVDYRGVEAVSLGSGRVLVVAVDNGGIVTGHILTLTATGITTTTASLASGASQLQGIVRHDANGNVLVPVVQGGTVEVLLLDTDGTSPTVTATRSVAAAKGWVAWCGDTPVCATLSGGGIATLRTMTAALADLTTITPNTVSWDYAALYGRPDGRLLVAGTGDGVEGTTPPGESWSSLIEGTWLLYHVDAGAFTLVDQIIPPGAGFTNRRGDHVVPIDDDTALINNPLDNGAIVSLAGVFHATWMTTAYEWDSTKVIEINPNVTGGNWITPDNTFYNSMRVIEFNTRGVPVRVTRRVHSLYDPNHYQAAVPVDDSRFLVAGYGEPTFPTDGNAENYLQVWELGDDFELSKVAQTSWDYPNDHSNPWMVRLGDGRFAYVARHSTTHLIFAIITVDQAGTPTVAASQLIAPVGGTGNSSFNEQHPYRLFLVAEDTLVVLYESNAGYTVVMKVTISGDTFTASAPALSDKLGGSGARDNHPCQIGSSIYHLIKYTGSNVSSRWSVPNPGTGPAPLAHMVKIDLDDSVPEGLSGVLLTPDITDVPPSNNAFYESLRVAGVVSGFNDGVIVPLDDDQVAIIGGTIISMMGDNPATATRWRIDSDAQTFVYIEDSETAYSAAGTETYPMCGVRLGDGKACFLVGMGEMYGRGAPYGYNENGFVGTVRVLTPRAQRGAATVGENKINIWTYPGD